MKSEQRWYLLGITLVVLLIIGGQLIWMMDPIRIGQHAYWIELVDYLVYLCLLPPILWVMSAVQGLRNRRFLNSVLFTVRLGIVISSVTAISFILIGLNHLIIIGISLATAFMLSLAAMVIEQWLVARRLPIASLLQSAVMLGVLALLLFPTSYMVTYPGLTVNMNHYAKVEIKETVSNVHRIEGTEEHTGDIMGLLVFERPAFPIDWLYAQLFEHYDFRKIQPTDLPLGEQLHVVRSLKHSADQVGSAIAFEKTGIGEGITFHGARIIGILPGTPAAEQLQNDDVIIELNDHPVASAAQLIAQTSRVKPGDELHLMIRRGNEHHVVVLKTQAAQDDPNKAIIGVQISDETKLDLPLKVVFQPYLLHEGGPSHGAMLTLALIDQLTPGGVSNGNIIAGTGTIELDGTVGRIGGIKQKAFTVERAGADVFFVPVGQQEDARKGAKHLNIVPVQTLDQILQWLHDHPKQ